MLLQIPMHFSIICIIRVYDQLIKIQEVVICTSVLVVLIKQNEVRKLIFQLVGISKHLLTNLGIYFQKRVIQV